MSEAARAARVSATAPTSATRSPSPAASLQVASAGQRVLLVDEDVRWSSLSDVEEESLLSFDVLRVDVCVGRLFPSVVEVGRLSLPLSLVSLELLV